MTKNYQCYLGLYHDKPVEGRTPSSNNGWIYTAYGRYIMADGKFTLKRKQQLLQTFHLCTESLEPLKINRLPGKVTPPMSRDEIIGLASLGLLRRHELEASYWNFCNFTDYKPEKLTWPKIKAAAKTLWNIRKLHRNAVWKMEAQDAYCLAFYLPPQDQYYIRELYNHKTTLLQTVAFYADLVWTPFFGDKSNKLILWLKLKDIRPKLARLLPIKKYIREYFGSEHIFTRVGENDE